MEKGFWKDFEEYKEEDEDAEMDGFLQSELSFSTSDIEDYDGKEDDEPNYLHGDCTVFAQCLNETYGYNIECVYQMEDDEEEPQLVHAYCTTKIDGKKVYIDARGMTDDYEKFMAEYYDAGLWSNDDYSYIHCGLRSIPTKYEEEKDSYSYQAAMQVIEDFPEYYKAA